MDATERLAKRRIAKASYNDKPRYRKAAVLQQILGTSFIVPMAAFMSMSYAIPVFEPVIGRIGILTVFAILVLGMLAGVIFVCVMTLTGPVYKNQIDVTTSDLETWGLADRISAAILSVLAIGVVAWIANRLYNELN